MASLKSFVPTYVKAKLKDLLNFPKPYDFYRSHSIKEQQIDFYFNDQIITVLADSATPLYDTVYEIIDFDSYQIKDVDWRTADTHLNIVDIGANIGVTALIFSKIVGSKVFCFEPVVENCVWIEKNLKINNCENVKVIQSAVAKHSGNVFFETNDVSVGGKVVNTISKNVATQRNVSAINLKEMLSYIGNETIFFLKIDCEGGEYDIIEQFDGKIATRVRYISMEIHDIDSKRNIRTISRQLESLGYNLFYKKDPFGRSSLHHLLCKAPV